MTPFKAEKIKSEFSVHATRSSGKGGQHVNKVSTKIEARFNVPRSEALTETEKALLLKKLKSKITDDGDIIVTSQASRSQLMNRNAATEKLLHLIEKALIPVKKRLASGPSLAAKEKRLKEKRSLSEKKQIRSEKIDPGL